MTKLKLMALLLSGIVGMAHASNHDFENLHRSTTQAIKPIKIHENGTFDSFFKFYFDKHLDAESRLGLN
jgi:hypothetical protein